MLENIRVNWQSSIRIEGKEAVIYIDPWKLEEADHDADVICITHAHFDHFSPEDIAAAANAGTVLIAPASMEAQVRKETQLDRENYEFLAPGEELEVDATRISAVPAYNVGKEFHKKEYGWNGYLIGLDGMTYYISGDTDVNEDNRKIRCDAALLPVGGYYTMNAEEAAALVREIRPKYAVPTHYGCVEQAGTPRDGAAFAEAAGNAAEVILKLGE